MENDSEQLYFNFDEYDDSENPTNNEYFATREELNYNAVQAIQKSEQILDRFESLELLNAYSFIVLRLFIQTSLPFKILQKTLATAARSTLPM